MADRHISTRCVVPACQSEACESSPYCFEHQQQERDIAYRQVERNRRTAEQESQELQKKRELHRKNRERYRNCPKQLAARLAKYDLTPERYAEMVDAQGGRCLICGEDKPLAIDHCHASGKVRGLLCSHCNRGLGLFFDMPHKLVSAAKYLKQYG